MAATRSLRPMKAVPGALPVGPDWVYEIKWDGMRLLVHCRGEEAPVLWTSSGADAGARFPELAGLSAAVGVDAVLDGEVVALDDGGRPSFSALQQRMHVHSPAEARRRSIEVPVALQVFDVLRVDGRDTCGLPLRDRRRLLEQLLEPGPAWRLVEQFDDGPGLFDHVTVAGLEGLIAKRRDSPYRPGARSRAWVKVKVRAEQEFVVGGFSTGRGTRTGRIGSLLVGYHEAGRLRYAGRVGSGLSQAEVDRLGRELAGRTADADPFEPPVPRADRVDATFVRPEVVVQVAFAEWSPDRRLRHPVYRGQRFDVDPAHVVDRP